MANPRRRNDEANQKSFPLAVSLVEASYLSHSQGPGYFTSLYIKETLINKQKMFQFRRKCMGK